MTFDGEEEQGGSSLVLLGVAAFVLSLFFVLGAGAVFVGMSSGMFDPTDSSMAEVRDPDPVVAPTPPPAPPVPEQPEPVEQVEPVEPVVAPEPPQPTIAAQPEPPVQPQPQPVRPPPAPQPRNDGVVAAQPVPKPPPAPQPQPVAKSSVVVTTNPPGAQVEIGGQSWGETPTKRDLPPGSYDYKLTKSGFQVAAGKLEVGAEPVYLDKSLAAIEAPEPAGPSSGIIMVFARGFVGAELLMDGKPIGKLPARIADVSAGPHEFVIRSADGDLTMRHDVVFTDATGPAVVNLVP